MTLVELMVVIVILVTLVAGVLPLVSPNNEARKIADAARSLQTYFMQAQSEAARLGRPVGVGFRESAPGSGVALEVFQLAVPKPYTGATINSRAVIRYPVGQYGDSNLLPNLPDPEGGKDFVDMYGGREVYSIRFVKAPVRKHPSQDKLILDAEIIPHGMFKIGDVANLEGNQFLIVDTDYNKEVLGYKDEELGSRTGFSDFHGVWINDNGQALRTIPIGSNDPGIAKPYAVHRQPSNDKFGVSAESAYQFPSGVAIDLQGSGVEGLGLPETFAENREVDPAHGNHNQYKASPDHVKQIGIMFSPHGGIEGVWVNDGAVMGSASARSGNKLTDVSRIFLLLGRVENGNPTANDYTLANDPSDDELRESRARVNWLNGDSRWLMINSLNGRVKVEPNAIADPRLLDYDHALERYSTQELAALGGNAELYKIVQIEAAHGTEHGHNDE